MSRDDWIQNFSVLAGFAFVIWLVVHGSRSERWRRAWLRLRRDKIGVVSGVIIALYLVTGALEMLQVPSSQKVPVEAASTPPSGAPAPPVSILSLIARHTPTEKTYSAPLAKTTLSTKKPEPLQGWHLLGTDALGKDVFFETLRACRTALIIGGLTSLIYIPVGTLFGILAGYFRKWVDDLIQYTYTVIYSIPDILFLVAMLVVLGNAEVKIGSFVIFDAGKSLGKMAFTLAVYFWITLCRMIRGETMRQTERPYVAAARALGQSHWNIITHHLLPNVMHLVLINLVLGFSNLVLYESMLSYLGVGSPIGTPSWGNMIDSARGELSRDPVVWWNLSSATAALFGLVFSLNLFGDALRRAFDPRRG
ncbi:MAG TPA: ABC transporter permease [Chthoniobacteraceae bacterium]|jgi:peptide/nickel transport system permease protein